MYLHIFAAKREAGHRASGPDSRVGTQRNPYHGRLTAPLLTKKGCFPTRTLVRASAASFEVKK